MWLASVATVEVIETASSATSRELDYTIIFVALIAAVGSVLSVLAGRAAKTAATATRESNANDHGEVAKKLDELSGIAVDLINVVDDIRAGQANVVEKVTGVEKRLDAVGQNFMDHMQYHLEHPHPVGDPA